MEVVVEQTDPNTQKGAMWPLSKKTISFFSVLTETQPKISIKIETAIYDIPLSPPNMHSIMLVGV